MEEMKKEVDALLDDPMLIPQPLPSKRTVQPPAEHKRSDHTNSPPTWSYRMQD